MGAAYVGSDNCANIWQHNHSEQPISGGHAASADEPVTGEGTVAKSSRTFLRARNRTHKAKKQEFQTSLVEEDDMRELPQGLCLNR